MNINIALNTIIIIMVFLFPGVLFRKFYFTGNFGNQFGQGNLLERFLWSVFLTFICLTSVSLILYFLNVLCGIKPLDDINFNRVSCIFQSLSENKFPGEFKEKQSFISFLFLLLFIYVISSALGYVTNKLLFLFSLENFSAFKFNNNWHYLSKAYKANNVRKNIGDLHITYVDVLTSSNSNEILYRGILNKFILDKDDKLENIVLSKAYRFITLDRMNDVKKIESIENSIEKNENIYLHHRQSNDRVVYTKSIDGNLLVLSKENISNINFTYIKISNRIVLIKELFYKIIRVVFIFITLALIILPFLQIDNYYLSKLSKKIVFSLTTFFFATLVTSALGRLLKPQNTSDNDRTTALDIFFIGLIFASPYMWVFNFFEWYKTLLIAFGILILFAFISSKTKRK